VSLPGPPEPAPNDEQIVFAGPDERKDQIRDVSLGALCAVTEGVTPPSPPFCLAANRVHLQAENFAAQSGDIMTFGSPPQGITNVDDGDWVRYSEVNFGDGTLDTFVAFMATRHSGNKVEVHLDNLRGKEIASLKTRGKGKDDSDFDIEDGNHFSTYIEQRTPMASVTGVHDVFIRFEGRHHYKKEHSDEDDHFKEMRDIGNFDWFALRRTGERDPAQKP
jgi:hypothetical protein